MESNWRFDVWAYGLANAGLELIARVHLFGTENLLVAKRVTFDERVAIYLALDTDIPGFLGEYLPPADHPHFPYGLEVDPD